MKWRRFVLRIARRVTASAVSARDAIFSLPSPGLPRLIAEHVLRRPRCTSVIGYVEVKEGGGRCREMEEEQPMEDKGLAAEERSSEMSQSKDSAFPSRRVKRLVA